MARKKLYQDIDLAPYIQELIYLNECIILPGFGGFETTYQPARFDVTLNRMLPPSKKVTYRPDYVEGNAVLENYLVQKLKIKPEEAREVIDDYVATLYNTIDQNKEITLWGIGFFRKLPDGKLEYRPLDEESYLAESFGLTELTIIPKQATPVSKTTEIPIQTPAPPRSDKRNIMTISLGVIAVLLLATFVVLLINSFEIKIFPFTNQDNLVPEDNMMVFGTRTPDTTMQIIARRLDDYTSAKTALRPNAPTVNGEKFFIVAGSFSKKANAGKLYLELENKGYKPRMIYSDDLFRVVIGNFTTKEQALDELYRIRSSLDRSIWLMSE